MNKTLLKNILGSEAHWQVNKALARRIGLEAAVLVGDLITQESYWVDKDKLDDNGGFFYTVEKIRSQLGIGKKPVARLQKILLAEGIVIIKKRGVPAKNYWYLQHEKLLQILSEPLKGSTGEPLKGIKSEPLKGIAINNNIDNNKNKKIIMSETSSQDVPKKKAIHVYEVEEMIKIANKMYTKEFKTEDKDFIQWSRARKADQTPLESVLLGLERYCTDTPIKWFRLTNWLSRINERIKYIPAEIKPKLDMNYLSLSDEEIKIKFKWTYEYSYDDLAMMMGKELYDEWIKNQTAQPDNLADYLIIGKNRLARTG